MSKVYISGCRELTNWARRNETLTVWAGLDQHRTLTRTIRNLSFCQKKSCNIVRCLLQRANHSSLRKRTYDVNFTSNLWARKFIISLNEESFPRKPTILSFFIFCRFEDHRLFLFYAKIKGIPSKTRKRLFGVLRHNFLLHSEKSPFLLSSEP